MDLGISKFVKNIEIVDNILPSTQVQELLIFIKHKQGQLYNSQSAHQSQFSPRLWPTPQLPFENPSTPSHIDYFSRRIKMVTEMDIIMRNRCHIIFN